MTHRGRSDIGPIIVSLAVLVGFSATVFAILTRPIPAGNAQYVLPPVCAICGLALAVGSYWLTRDSKARHDDLLSSAQSLLAASTPPKTTPPANGAP